MLDRVSKGGFQVVYISISFSLSNLKHVMCLGVKKIFERRKESEKVLYCFERFMISPYATVGLL